MPFAAKSLDIGLDLGNSKFSICAKDEGVIVSEAPYIAYRGHHLSESSIIAVGDEAKSMWKRTPIGLNVVTPMREGVIVDCKVAGYILQRLAKKAGLTWRLARPRAIVGALFGASDIEKKAFIDTANVLRFSQTFTVPEPLAAANGIGIDVTEPHANMVVDIGEGATEAIIVSMGETVLGSSLRLGGADMDLTIIEHIRKNYGIIISEEQARKIKEKVSCEEDLLSSQQGDDIVVRGLKLVNAVPCSISIPRREIYPVLNHVSEQIVRFVLTTLEQAPPEVSVDLIDNGIYLCGGAAQTHLLRKKISERTKLNVKTIASPEKAVILGCQKMLNYTKY